MGTGEPPWALLLMLPIHAVAGLIGIALAGLFLGRRWDTEIARTGRINGGMWLCVCARCGQTFGSTDRAATDCGNHTDDQESPMDTAPTLDFATDIIARIDRWRADHDKLPLKPHLASYYGVLVVATGEATTAELLHDAAWAMHAASHRPGHPQLIRWADLPPSEQERDEDKARMIRQIAADLRADHTHRRTIDALDRL